MTTSTAPRRTAITALLDILGAAVTCTDVEELHVLGGAVTWPPGTTTSTVLDGAVVVALDLVRQLTAGGADPRDVITTTRDHLATKEPVLTSTAVDAVIARLDALQRVQVGPDTRSWLLCRARLKAAGELAAERVRVTRAVVEAAQTALLVEDDPDTAVNALALAGLTKDAAATTARRIPPPPGPPASVASDTYDALRLLAGAAQEVRLDAPPEPEDPADPAWTTYLQASSGYVASATGWETETITDPDVFLGFLGTVDSLAGPERDRVRGLADAARALAPKPPVERLMPRVFMS